MIVCRTLGPAEISVDGRPAPPELLWKKPLGLLIYLARSPRRARTREHLIGLFWADKPEGAARHSLNEALRLIRRAAGDGVVETEGGQIRLASGAVELDTDRFQQLSEAKDWPAAAELIKGAFLEGFGIPGASGFEDWLTAERDHWSQRAVSALIAKAETDLASGNTGGAVDAARRAWALDPLSDTAIRAVMRSLALDGDRAGALDLYAVFAARMQDSIGTQPDLETRTLADRVRRQRGGPGPGAPAAAREAESRRTPLVGRERDLSALQAHWTASRLDGRATVVVLQGDAGLGKTRLAEEMLARARLDGAAVASVRAVEADLGEPWSGVIALARGGLLEAAGLSGSPASSLAAFTAQVPEWADRFADAVRGVAPAPMGRALSEGLRAVTQEQPVFLVIDDAQWLDGESLRALIGSVRDLAQAPLCLLLAVTPTPTRPELDDLRTRLNRDLPGTALTLMPLDAEGVRALARWLLPNYSETELDRVTRRVMADSAGLPLLAVELFHAVRLGLNLQDAPVAWPEPLRTLDQSLPGDLPDNVIAALRIGFRRLSPVAQQVLAAAAVLGDRVSVDTLALASRLEPETLLAALDELEWRRWLIAEPRGYSFLARIVREVVARDMLTPGQRQRLVQRVTPLDPPA